MNNPCWKCVERVFGCHAGCSRYIQWRSEHTALAERIKEERRKEQEILDEPFRAVERSKK